jgi:amidase
MATIGQGEEVRIETAWPLGIRMRSLADPRPPRQIAITGPIAVRGAEPGDALRVTIHAIDLPDWGKVWTAPWLGVLQDVPLYERRLPIHDGLIHFNSELRIPVRPMVGFVGVAPGRSSIDCLAAGDHGGNMDTLSVGPGSTVVLPVNVSGALLALGDVHAAMGEGEVIGIALEVGAELSISVEVVPQGAPPCPMVDTERHVAVVVTEERFEAAAERAVRIMRELLAARLGVSREEAYALVGMSGDLRISQNVNPYGVTLRLEIPRSVWDVGSRLEPLGAHPLHSDPDKPTSS